MPMSNWVIGTNLDKELLDWPIDAQRLPATVGLLSPKFIWWLYWKEDCFNYTNKTKYPGNALVSKEWRIA